MKIKKQGCQEKILDKPVFTMYNHLGVKSLDKRFDSQKKIQENAVIIDISDILSCENKEETKQVQIELTSFISKLGKFPIISAAPIELRIANREIGRAHV